MQFEEIYDKILQTLGSFAYETWLDKIHCESNITDNLQESIVEFHNEMRSDLARGDFDGYESGTNIYTMRWNCNLAKLAQERANSCGRTKELDYFSGKIGEVTYQQLANESKNNDDYFNEAMDYWSNATEPLNQSELYKVGPACETWKDCSTYKESVCYFDSKLCDFHSGKEIHDSFDTFLASNGTIDIPNLEEHTTTFSINSSHGNINDSENDNVKYNGDRVAQWVVAQLGAPMLRFVAAQSCNKKSISDDLRADILFIHNVIRSQLAYGDFKSLPSGSNIYSLKWSCELERLAQQNADFSIETCKMSRKQDAHIPFETGQNIFKIKTNESFNTDHWFDKALDFWTNETRESHEVAQILYGKTLLIGCGIRKCRESEVVIVCQYWPKATPGPLYRQGSSCETGNYCDAYNQSSCDSEMSLCQVASDFTFPDPLHALPLQTTPITEVPNIENVTYTPTTEMSISSETLEKIVLKQYNCHDTKLLTSYRSLLKMKHEEYRKKAAKGIITLHNFENIEEDFFFKLDWNCELEKEAQKEAERCALPPHDAKHKYYRTIIHNFEFGNLADFLDQKIDYAISNWWGNITDYDNINIAQFEATEIGCGIASCIDENLQMVIDIVCRYWPTTNPNELYNYAISCERNEHCDLLPNSFCDTNLGICVEGEARKKSSVKKSLDDE
ncbi:unnamed protein product [Dracunculus medinensis]|uniref:SCP domain-containing protein n=1 Tax=Dracunculus medinensis TaxID=318479 RepID=A0A0N4UHD8_DRAME|nr:unnamed protein product [Dracunculus medinensis]